MMRLLSLRHFHYHHRRRRHLLATFFKLRHYFSTPNATPPSPSISTTLLQPPLHHSKPGAYVEKSLISLIKSISSQSQLRNLHALLITTSFITKPNVFFHFLSRLSLPPSHNLSYSHKLLSLYPRPNILLYNLIIRAYSLSNRDSHFGFVAFRELLRLGISPNSEAASMCIKCCANMRSVISGSQIHKQILKRGHGEEVHLLTTLMVFYSSNGMIHEATKVFQQMPKIDTYVYNVLIGCYTRNGRPRDALTMFGIMARSEGCEPDNVTCVHILQACANVKELAFGEKVHNYVKECGFHGDVYVCNALISMYSRCGRVEKAKEVFQGMIKRDVVTWTALISGFANGGYEIDAIEAFRQMVREGIVPDQQTFTAVLSACSKKGLLKEGRMFFHMMSKEFGIAPNVCHYGCLVDLLGRAGLLQEAYEVILSMRVKPNAELWWTLLGACNKHRNVVLAEQVVQHLIEFKAQAAGDYVLLLNMYMSAGDLEKVKGVEKLIERNRTKFSPSCSTIILKGKVHVFGPDHISHLQNDMIYTQLEEINQQLKFAGYVAEMKPELQSELATKEPVTSVSYHSEKLAIAFGILSTPPGRKIIVAKDIWMCDDCHNFAKMVSSVYDREVIVQDSIQCHHFQGGHCSCNKEKVKVCKDLDEIEKQRIALNFEAAAPNSYVGQKASATSHPKTGISGAPIGKELSVDGCRRKYPGIISSTVNRIVQSILDAL